MNKQIEQADHSDDHAGENSRSYDYAHVNSIARIALYDDLLSAPRVTEIQPAPTADFIESLASHVYEQAKMSGGTIPYTVIREVSENFIHARFTEVTISILDGGNTIRFADQGPGIVQKDKAQIPGFTSAIEPMKHYIRGVGSGLPIVKEYLDFSHGTITIEDNLGTGSVVTISLKRDETKMDQPLQQFTPPQNGMYSQSGQPSGHMISPSQTGSAYPQYQQSFVPGANPYGTQSPYGLAPQTPGGIPPQQHSLAGLIPPLSQRERDFLPIFLNEGALGVTDLTRITGVPQSSTYVTLSKLEQAGLIEKTVGQKRILTDLGYQVANSL